MKSISLLITIAVTISVSLCSTPSNETLATKLDAYFKEQTQTGFTGAVLIARDGRVVFDKTFDSPINRNVHQAYWLASNSKPLLAIAVMRLQERGKLSLNDPISKFFKDVPEDKRAITVRELLTHTAGLPHRYVADGIANRDEAVRAILALPLQWKIGEGYHYSNDGYNLLAAVVEIASGKSFETCLRDEVFKPAGMKESGFWGYQDDAPLASIPDSPQVKNQMPTILRAGKSVANWGYRGATGIYSTTADLYQLANALRRGALLSNSSRDAMWSPQVFIRHDPQEDVYYGYGWVVTVKDNKRVAVRHAGDEEWLRHNGIIWLYENGDALIVLSNAGAINGRGRSAIMSRDLDKILRESTTTQRIVGRDAMSG